MTQAAVSQQVRQLEQQLGVTLFRRLPRGLALTDEALALLPALQQAFDHIDHALARVATQDARAVVSIGVVGTFAVGWLLPRLDAFLAAHAGIDVRVSTHNNKLDMMAEGLDLAVRYGAGTWPGLDASRLLAAPLTPLCDQRIAGSLQIPADLARATLLRTYFVDDWRLWFEAALAPNVASASGPIFDSSLALAQYAMRGGGVALLPPVMFADDIAAGRLVQPFDTLLPAGDYWLVRPQTRPPTPAAQVFAQWMLDTTGG